MSSENFSFKSVFREHYAVTFSTIVWLTVQFIAWRGAVFGPLHSKRHMPIHWHYLWWPWVTLEVILAITTLSYFCISDSSPKTQISGNALIPFLSTNKKSYTWASVTAQRLQCILRLVCQPVCPFVCLSQSRLVQNGWIDRAVFWKGNVVGILWF